MQRLDPKSTALLVVDVQERLAPAMDKDAFARATKSIDLLVTAARLLGLRTAVTEQYPKGLGPTLPELGKALEGLPAARFEKTCFSAADSPEVTRWLAQASPRTIVVTGVETHVCVFQTVRELVARGLEVHVPHDAVASRREDDRKTGLDLMRAAGATITTAETVVFDLLVKAEGDVFKELSKKMR
jgi:nicotinamidase-related amidase